MADQLTRAQVSLSDFSGLMTNMGPNAPPEMPGAAAIQVNLTGVRPGILEARPGTKPVEYDDEG